MGTLINKAGRTINPATNEPLEAVMGTPVEVTLTANVVEVNLPAGAYGATVRAPNLVRDGVAAITEPVGIGYGAGANAKAGTILEATNVVGVFWACTGVIRLKGKDTEKVYVTALAARS